MSIAEKLQTIAENEQRVYEAGKTEGKREWWIEFQQNGERNWYYSAFTGFYDNCYNPIFPIRGDLRQAFLNSKITDTKVDIDATEGDTRLDYLFGSSNIVKVRKLKVTENNTYTYAFRYADYLTEITFEGVIGQNLDISNSPLTHVCLVHILSKLKDMTGTGETRTIVLGSKNEPKLSDTEKLVATEKGWTIG